MTDKHVALEFQIELELKMLASEEGEKTTWPGEKKPQSKEKNE